MALSFRKLHPHFAAELQKESVRWAELVRISGAKLD